MLRKGFRKGLNHVKHGEYDECVEELIKFLQVTTMEGFRYYAYGRGSSLDKEKAKAIEDIFKKYGVPRTKVWDI